MKIDRKAKTNEMLENWLQSKNNWNVWIFHVFDHFRKLTVQVWQYFVMYRYNDTLCSHQPTLRYSLCLCDQEKNFLDKRKDVIRRKMVELIGEERGPRELDEVGLQWENIRKQFFRRKSGSSCFSSKTISLECTYEGFNPFVLKKSIYHFIWSYILLW